MAENKAQNTQKNTQKKDADRKKDARNRKRMGNQREIWLSAGSIGVLFLCLLVYLGHFVATSEQDMINNSYNSRQQILLSRNYRGSIYSRDGDVLAETILDADEEETRNYPYKNLFFSYRRLFHPGTHGSGGSGQLLSDQHQYLPEQ